MSLDNLAAWADFVDSASDGSWLIALVLVTFTMAVAGLLALVGWLHRLPTRQRPHRSSLGCQRYDPADDERDIDPPTQLEQIFRDELGQVDHLDAEWRRLNREGR